MEIGEIRRGCEIGKKHQTAKYIWHACVDCGKERWVQFYGGKPMDTRCRSCANRIIATGRRSNSWKGGITYYNGYVMIYKPEHQRARPKYGYVKRAILVLEQKLGRPMLPNTDSHHINGVRDDDRPENLMELSHGEHMRLPISVR